MLQENLCYLDYAATTPVDARVIEQMEPYSDQIFGNTSSVHRFGQQAEAALELARESLAYGLNCQEREVIFTACGSESDNIALRGVTLARRERINADHILTTRAEHHAVTHTVEQLANIYDFDLEYLPVDSTGLVDPADIASRLRSSTAIVSVMLANNEIGTINPIAEIGALCKEHGVPFHTDAVQGAAYLSVDVEALNVDLLSLGAHKFYGPKGIGALYIRSGTPLISPITGGGQEFGLRAGTHNTPYIVGMAKAFQLAIEERHARITHIKPLRDRLIQTVLRTIPESKLTGHPNKRMPNHASFVFRGVDGNALLMALDIEGFACSSGSACKTGDPEPSDVLTALGFDRQWALGSLRVTLGVDTDKSQIDAFLEVLPNIIERLRALD